MFEMNIRGLDEVQRKLEELARRAQELEGKKIPMRELFSGTFMGKYTTFPTFDAFFVASGFDAKTEEDFWKIPADQWDAAVKKGTRFQTWGEMKAAATDDYVKRHLGLS